jgi:hypothetical protein
MQKRLSTQSLSFPDAREEFVRAATQRERINLRKIKRYKVVFDKIPGSANGCEMVRAARNE